ncbi:malto-oligosyltrehalose synthase [Pseudolabrys sp. FHR47]|uniref:malto-oligosyltrehalose synthase n=1 Tax=Pseudolabrys sp. FHR47 TaxID=2562284 RepID=UPI0010BF1077|nr:malto-oligosyltrehalose synthase [Pseudolabrys sp. FHR47]
MPPAIPRATYRVQLTKDFTFDDAAAIVPYLKALGISHLYASPFLKARPGSTHGYDIVDHDRLNPELGGDEAFARMSDALKANDLGLILDFVPNHMGVGLSDNQWWLDVLEWGQHSPHAEAFDIDWEAIPYRRHPGVLLPILGRPYGDALQAGEIELGYDSADGSFAAWYFEHKLPINPQRYGEMLRIIVGTTQAEAERVGAALLKLADEFGAHGTPSYREAPKLKQALTTTEGAAPLIERGLSAYRGETGVAALHRLLERQHYRLAYWRVAFAAVNYRRFFDINDLAGLRVERPAVFRAIHPLVTRLIAAGQLQGLRLDHIDGLRDPAQYTRRLRQLVTKARGKERRGPFWIGIEKILGPGEPLPDFSGVAGTTGYEWLNVIGHVLADARGLDALEKTWRDFTGERATPAQMLDTAKRRVIDTMLASEFTVLGLQLARIAAGHFSTRDYTLNRLREALLLYVLEFPVYRTYVTAGGASDKDRAIIDATIARARARWGGPDPDVMDFLRDVITLDLVNNPGYSAPRVRNFALKLQQFTGPLMAKALEDTVFYRDHRFLAFNEVGGHPDAQALSPQQFHELQAERLRTSPAGLTATATHDTKRGEDSRMRILALSEMSDEWASCVKKWDGMNHAIAAVQDGSLWPSKAHQYMIYQALIGAWPETLDAEFTARMKAYALKAAREGKQETSWTAPNDKYEAALDGYIGALLDPARSKTFLESFGAFAARTALIGALNSLSQLALKVLGPGIPDIYQGTEYWDLSLVDPDNRRPVDFARRAAELENPGDDWPGLAETWRDSRIKLHLLHKLLDIRRAHAELFRRGDYIALDVSGPDADHVIAFARRWKRDEIVVAVGRHFAPKSDDGRRWPRPLHAAITLASETIFLDGVVQSTEATPLCVCTPAVHVFRRRIA